VIKYLDKGEVIDLSINRYHDDPVIDYLLLSKINHEYLGWALLQYLENKGLVEHDDFMKFFKAYLKADMDSLKEKRW